MYNPRGPFKRSGMRDDREAGEKESKASLIPVAATVDAVLRKAPVTDEEMHDMTSRPKDKLAEFVEPEKGEAYEAYVARLALTGKVPDYRVLSRGISARTDLVGTYWDRLKASAAGKVPPPGGEGTTQQTGGMTTRGEKK